MLPDSSGGDCLFLPCVQTAQRRSLVSALSYASDSHDTTQEAVSSQQDIAAFVALLLSVMAAFGH